MLDTIYLGNTLETWLYILFIASSAVLVGKFLYENKLNFAFSTQTIVLEK